MTIDPNAVINSPAPALFLALVLLGLFVAGMIVPGKAVDAEARAREASDEKWRGTIKDFTVALERRNDLDEQRIDLERSFEDRRGAPRPAGG